MVTSALEQAVGYTFKDRGLLRLALMHPSYLNEHPEETGGSNQRLEFLGDACIGLLIGREMYRRFPDLGEGGLTEARSRVVRDEALAGAARRLGLGKHLILGQGERSRGGGERDANLADAFEALAGAILLDGGYRSAQRVILTALRPEMRAMDLGPAGKDPKSQLQELAHLRGLGPPSYEVVKTEGPPHQPVYTIAVRLGSEALGVGEGRRKVDAERLAARAALEALGA
ncbi:MAG: ribonuclease III [Chloroflexi bacterium]|nr:ribonuclease III [Chloroflexota bacterium]